MRIPTIRGVIDRRILVNFRVDPEVLARLLPPRFRPQLVDGFGIAGICLIRLKHLRPKHLPSLVGFSSENAAHRIAVQWDDDGAARTGVYIPRRDTSSLFNVIAGGRLFPGVHHRARFETLEKDGRYRIAISSLDDSTRVLVDGQADGDLASDSVFESLDAASEFFETGSLGYSPRLQGEMLDGLELRSFNWRVEPLQVHRVESTFFDDRRNFPEGSVAFDSALLMRSIQHEWRGRASLCCSAAGRTANSAENR